MVTQLNVAFTIITIFILLGVILPYINDAFENDSTTLDTDIDTAISDDASELNSVSALDIVKSVAKMFFWTFGDLPFWLDAIFVIFRIALVLILIQYIPFVG